MTPLSHKSNMETLVRVESPATGGNHFYRPLVDVDVGEGEEITVGFWIRPDTDGDGEFALNFADLRDICRRFGLNHADLWPEGDR